MKVAWRVMADVAPDTNVSACTEALLHDASQNLILNNVEVKTEWILPTEEEQARETDGS